MVLAVDLGNECIANVTRKRKMSTKMITGNELEETDMAVFFFREQCSRTN